MGLDIYLIKCPDLAAAKAAQQARDEEVEALWDAVGGYENATEEQRTEIAAKFEEISKKHGCTGSFEQHASITEFDNQHSVIDPEHLFKVGYFCSDDNGGGIERVLKNIGLPTLHDIFQPNNEHEFKPDWDAALTRCSDVIVRYEEHLASPMGKYAAMFVDGFDAVPNERGALEAFAKELAREYDPIFRSYSNKQGTFYLDGIKAVSFMPGRSIIGTPGMYVVYEKETDDKPNWHLVALKIVRETIEYVIAQPDRQEFYLVWSG